MLTGLETDRFFALRSTRGGSSTLRAPVPLESGMLDVTTGRTTELTHGTSLIERPRVSPDGASVVFNVGHDPHTNLYTLPVAGGTPKQLTFFDALTVAGAWSADGQRIAFASTQGGRARVWTMAATGVPTRPLSVGEVSDNLDVSWGPGQRILYQRAGNQNYYELDPDTSIREVPGAGTGRRGGCSPRSTRPRRNRIAVMWIGLRREASGSSTAAITARGCSIPPAERSVRPIGWSRDGEWIYAVEGKNRAVPRRDVFCRRDDDGRENPPDCVKWRRSGNRHVPSRQ